MLRKRLAYIIIGTVHIFVFLMLISNWKFIRGSNRTYTCQDTVQPVQHLLPDNGHCKCNRVILDTDLKLFPEVTCSLGLTEKLKSAVASLSNDMVCP
jgi:hypothetical protein